MLGLTAPQGSFTQLGLLARPGVQQGIEVLVRRPAGLGTNADGVRLVLEKVSSVTTAVDVDVHLLGLRKASEAEIAAGQTAANLAAAVSTLSTTITGVADALAAYQVVANAARPRSRAATMSPASTPPNSSSSASRSAMVSPARVATCSSASLAFSSAVTLSAAAALASAWA